MNANATVPAAVQGDLHAMLQKIRELEAEKQALTGEKQTLLQSLAETEARASQLSEKTRQEMANKVNTTIATWLQSMPEDTLSPEKREQVMNGLHELAKATAQESGLYQVMCCASEQHITNVARLEEVRRERDELQQRLEGGTFASEDARLAGKRKADVISADAPAKPGMWDDFQIMLQQDKGWSSAAPQR
jgi:hypothetical protein